MIVTVIREYRDKGEGNILRPLHSVIDYADDKRAKELIEKGFVKEAKIIKVGATKKTKKQGD